MNLSDIIHTTKGANVTKDQTQLERFKEAAREVEADTSEDALDKIMGKLDLKKPPEEIKEDD